MVRTDDIPSLKPKPTGEVESAPHVGSHIYWKLPDGWITHAPSNPMEWQRRVQAGQTPLPQYGQFPYSRKTVDADGHNWDARAQPWRMFFQRGGVKELCLEQIIGHNWHIRPPYREVEFPQLQETFWEVYECPDCERSVFTSLEDGFAPFTLITHLRYGHGWSRAEVAEWAREVGINFKRPRRKHEPREIEPEAATLGTTDDEPERDENYKCDICGWAPLMVTKRKDTALMGHKRKHRVGAKSPAPKEE